MIDKGQWWEFGQDTGGYIPTLYEKCHRSCIKMVIILFAKQETTDLFGINKAMARVDNLIKQNTLNTCCPELYTHNAFLQWRACNKNACSALHFPVDNDINSTKKLIS